MKDFFIFVQQNADRLCDLPNKLIDTNMILLAQLILCLSVYSATLYLSAKRCCEFLPFSGLPHPL